MNRAESKAYEQYRRLAGEVEARNVSARINMTPEERRATLLSETEDVACEDQIFLRDGVEIAMAEAEDVKSEDRLTKHKTEEIFGGIWIVDKKEFAKFVSAVNTYPTDENGEGIAKTSDYLYLYYRGIGERIIPFASVYLNKGESQNVANELINAWNNGEKGKVREYIDGAYEVTRDVNVQGNILDGTDKELSATRENDILGSELSQLGRYYYTPELYSKVKRADSGSRGQGKVNYSLITPEMDASYLDAVERGDMEAVQRMVMEAAKIAMPNTKVVDENGNPKVVYHGTIQKILYCQTLE